VAAVSGALRLVPLGTQRHLPWANGGGTTREVAIDPDGSSLANGCRWRVSCAHVATDGPFSVLPGIDRSLWLLRGDGLVLATPEHTLVLDQRGQRVDFAGETPVHATLLGGACDDVNVMVARDRVAAHAELLELAAGERTAVPAAPQHLLLSLEGSFRVGAPAVPAVLAADGDAVRIDGAGALEVAAVTRCWLLTARFSPRG
jgi:environmental stress-induced protein Ves